MTRHGSLAGPTLKLRRAKEHLNAFERETSGFFGTDTYRAVREGEMEGSYEIVRAAVSRGGAVPVAHGLLVGDCLHNLRSALDHLVFQLAIEHQGRVLSQTEGQAGSFPIVADRASRGMPEFLKGKPGRDLKYVSPKAQAVIHALQPCHARYPDRTWLAILGHLDNIDKHRRLLLGGTALGSATWPTDAIDVTLNVRGLVKDGTEIGRIKWRGEPPGPEVDVNDYFSFTVAFREGRPVQVRATIHILMNIFVHIRERVFPRFEEFFP